jgi:putative selenate reductase
VVPISFSAGIDANNFASAVAMNMVPVTTCTDLLRPGGYARLIRYMDNLGAAMREVGATTIPEFITRYRSQGSNAAEAGLLNTPLIVAEATANPRYGWAHNQGVPRKIGSKLWFYDCINCDKCVPVCPNDANFTYEPAVDVLPYDNFELTTEGIRRIPGGMLKLVRKHQLANYADACNECGNCDVMCPEDGGPFIAKPRFFSSYDSYRRFAGRNGFYIHYDAERKTIHGIIDGKSYTLLVDAAADRAWFDEGHQGVEIQLSTGDVVRMGPARKVDMQPYHHLKLLLDAVSSPRHVHFANVAGLSIQENTVGNQASASEG